MRFSGARYHEARSAIKSDFNRVIHSVNNLSHKCIRGKIAASRAQKHPKSARGRTGYPHLWISCGYWRVVKWITCAPDAQRRSNADPEIARRGVHSGDRGRAGELIHRESTLLITHRPSIPRRSCPDVVL